MWVIIFRFSHTFQQSCVRKKSGGCQKWEIVESSCQPLSKWLSTWSKSRSKRHKRGSQWTESCKFSLVVTDKQDHIYPIVMVEEANAKGFICLGYFALSCNSHFKKSLVRKCFLEVSRNVIRTFKGSTLQVLLTNLDQLEQKFFLDDCGRTRFSFRQIVHLQTSVSAAYEIFYGFCC